MTNRLIKERKKKLDEIEERGLEPFDYTYDRTHTSSDIVNGFDKVKDRVVKVAGRIRSIRDMGKVCFMDIQDGKGQLQLFFRVDNLENYDRIDLLDMGDFIGASGKVFKTKRGEISINVSEFKILTKSLRPLPEKWHGLKDPEKRYRQRYLDLIMNPEVRKVFKKRSEIYKAIRGFLDERGYLEVRTPILQTQYGGANACPFVTKINAWNMKMYLRIAYEMHLKRLIVGGFEKIYDLSSCFRNEGVDKTHNPEFAMMEIQTAYKDYNYVMELTENLFEYVAKKVNGTTKIKYRGHEVDLKAPWKRITVKDALKKYASIDVDEKNLGALKEIADKHRIEYGETDKKGHLILVLFEELCEEKLIGPVHVTDHPKESCPLSKPHRENPELVERVEPFICGVEIGNGYSELTDPILQNKLLKEQEERGRGGDEEAHPMDEDFVRALEYGLPPNAGMGIGIDRMVMMITGQESIRDVILFPVMKPIERENGENVEESKGHEANTLLIAEEVKKRFPGMKVGYAVIDNMSIKKKDTDLEEIKKKIIETKGALSGDDLKKNKKLNAYRNLFKETGVDMHSRKPSPDALLTRVIEGKDLYLINSLVDAYNIASLETSLGMGALDFKKLKLPLELRFSDKGEQITIIGGEKKDTKAGELVYSDQEGIITLDLNYRDCERTKVTKQTKRALVIVDGAPGISREDIEKGLDRAVSLITNFSGGRVIEKNIV